MKSASLQVTIVLYRSACWVRKSLDTTRLHREQFMTIDVPAICFKENSTQFKKKHKDEMYRWGKKNICVRVHYKNSGQTIAKLELCIFAHIKIHVYPRMYVYTHTYGRIRYLRYFDAPGMFGTSFFRENIIEATAWRNCRLQQLEDLSTVQVPGVKINRTHDVIKMGPVTMHW